MTSPHASSCALHNATASEPGPCDCGATDILERIEDKLAGVLPGAVAQLLAECAITIKAYRGEKDEAYRQRNHLVAALARLFPSGITKTDIPGWLPEWHGCCFIDLPAGQISYHYHDSHALLFAGLPPYFGLWDGHDKETVHVRLATLECAALLKPSKCAASYSTDPPQDCDYPFCGCDPKTQDVIAALQECGYLSPKEVAAELERSSIQFRDALLKYGHHLGTCQAIVYGSGPCTCGFEQARGKE